MRQNEWKENKKTNVAIYPPRSRGKPTFPLTRAHPRPSHPAPQTQAQAPTRAQPASASSPRPKRPPAPSHPAPPSPSPLQSRVENPRPPGETSSITRSTAKSPISHPFLRLDENVSKKPTFCRKNDETNHDHINLPRQNDSHRCPEKPTSCASCERKLKDGCYLQLDMVV
jgi:hypothetical protein